MFGYKPSFSANRFSPVAVRIVLTLLATSLGLAFLPVTSPSPNAFFKRTLKFPVNPIDMRAHFKAHPNDTGLPALTATGEEKEATGE